MTPRVTAPVFASAMALAGVTGYWCGSLKKDSVGAVESGRKVSARASGVVSVLRPAQSGVDFIHAILHRQSDPAEQWRGIRNFSEDEIKMAISEMGEISPLVNEPRVTMLYYRWAQIDPVAAYAAAEKLGMGGIMGPARSEREAVATAWLKQDPGGAWARLRSESGLYACTESFAGNVAGMLAATLSDEDDATAFRRIAGYRNWSEEEYEEEQILPLVLADARAEKAWVNPAAREAFLAAAAGYPDPYVLLHTREVLFREWAKHDLAAALAGLATPEVPAEERDDIRRRIHQDADFAKGSAPDSEESSR